MAERASFHRPVDGTVSHEQVGSFKKGVHELLKAH